MVGGVRLLILNQEDFADLVQSLVYEDVRVLDLVDDHIHDSNQAVIFLLELKWRLGLIVTVILGLYWALFRLFGDF